MDDDISALRRILTEEIDAIIKALKHFQSRINVLDVPAAQTSFDDFCREFIKDRCANQDSCARRTTDDGKSNVVCMWSKEEATKPWPFFFTFTIGQAEFLDECQQSYVILICKLETQVLRISWSDFKELRGWIGEREVEGEKKGLWDIRMKIDGKTQYILSRKGRKGTKILTKYLF